MGIREHWDKEESPLRTSLKSLQEVLGKETLVEPEWQLLLAELDKFYADKENFVATVAGCVATWCKSLTELLEDEANEEWAETLLERITTRRLQLFIEVGIPT